MKQLYFVGSTLDALKEFPLEAKKEAGWQLDRVQHGLEPTDWKPMKGIGSGVREIRIHEAGEFRVIYVANIGDAVYALHAFKKKSQKTPKQDIELANKRFKQIRGG